MYKVNVRVLIFFDWCSGNVNRRCLMKDLVGFVRGWLLYLMIWGGGRWRKYKWV